MRRCIKGFITVSMFILFLGIPLLQAEWVKDGVPICTASDNQYDPQIASDDASGAIITWEDDRDGANNRDIYAQRIDANGSIHEGWLVNGIAVCTADSIQGSPQITSDGSEGAIITWCDLRSEIWSHDIYAQRVDADGSIHTGWTADGVAVCTATGKQKNPQITSDGSEGAIITWYDERNGVGIGDIYAQHIDADGSIHTGWPAHGLVICNAIRSQFDPQITSDGSGGAIITWQDKRVSDVDDDIYAQRIDADGSIHTGWQMNGEVVCDATDIQFDPQIVSDFVGGAIITWGDWRSVTRSGIYAQRIDANGNIHTGWPTNGVDITPSTTVNQYYPQITTDCHSGAIITWQERYDVAPAWDDIYAQKIGESGNIEWGGNGVGVCTADLYQISPQITSDSTGGAIITWMDGRTGISLYHIYAQAIDSCGYARYNNGISICTAVIAQTNPQITSNCDGGAIITWDDFRGSVTATDIYAMNLYQNTNADEYTRGLRTKQEWTYAEFSEHDGAIPFHLQTSAAVDTYTIVYYDFNTNDWQGWTREDNAKNYGKYSGLWIGLADKDPCGDNFSKQVEFFSDGGSNYGPMSMDYPGLYETPYCLPSGLCQDEMIISPVIDMTKYTTRRDGIQDKTIPGEDLPELGGAQLRFTVYRDLELPSLVFYFWRVRSYDPELDHGEWHDRNLLYYGSERDYQIGTQDISDLVGSDLIQVAIGVVDMYITWFGIYSGGGSGHTPAPWIDNVHIKRFGSEGPQWHYRSIDLFQDNFPENELDIESLVRADMAMDINSPYDPNIRPGDSVVVNCSAPNAGGLAAEGNGRASVFCHVLVSYIGDPAGPKTPPTGAPLEGGCGTYYDMEGSWTVIQCDSAYTSSGNPAPNKFCVDLNDSLFTRGFRIDYYFKARDLDANWSTLPERAQTHNTFFEFTCLPTLASDILYVDDFHGRGSLDGAAQHYMESSLGDVLPEDSIWDRYDVNGPSSLVSNGLGSRAEDSLLTYYHIIIWDSGNLRNGTISDGYRGDKSGDCQLLIDWMNISEHDCGLWICGDNIAEDLDRSTMGQASELLETWCGVTLVDDSYFDLAGSLMLGGTVSPFVQTVPGLPNGNPMHSDSFYVDGGCAIINAFDVLDITGASQYALKYPDYGGQSYYAGIQSESINAVGSNVKTMWFGFSFMYIRDALLPDSGVGIARNRIMKAFIDWMGDETNENITETETPAAYKLSQNFPNPFNPQTTILFSMREKGHVTIKIYNVAGQLVRTLVNDVKDAGSHRVPWDGRNNLGIQTTSGVYFYKMQTKNFSATRKMVMLR